MGTSTIDDELYEFAAEAAGWKRVLYHLVRWGLRVYFTSLFAIGLYSLLWVLNIAGMIPEGVLSAIWIGIAVMGSLFIILLIPLFYSTRSGKR